MASQAMLRTGITTPARAVLKPASSARSILKRPSPLPLSPTSMGVSASFSVVHRSGKLSPHVHFAASPALVATFSALSPNTYDRGPIIISPTSLDTSSWANRVYSPSAETFKLADPPSAKRKSERHLAIPISEDPRSPKPYVSKAAVRFEELPPRGSRGADSLGKALTSYPRSPYPSAPLSPSTDSEDNSRDIETSGKWTDRSSGADKRSSSLTRAKSLEIKSKRSISSHSHLAPPAQQFLSPVQESPRVTVTRPPPLNLTADGSLTDSTRLSHAFWESVSLEPSPVGAQGAVTSPTLPILFGKTDGTLWSPGIPKKPKMRTIASAAQPLSPAPKARLRKSVVASPSPNDPFAAFPSFSVALSGSTATITYPPRALREYD